MWVPGPAHREVQAVCPECIGTKVVMMVLENGSQFHLDCCCCQVGYDGPRGWVIQREVWFKPEVAIVAGVDFQDGETNYRTNRGCFREVYSTAEECQPECDRRQAEYEADEERRSLANLQSKRRDCAWSVHYWGRKVKELERDLEAARARLHRIKAEKKEASHD